MIVHIAKSTIQMRGVQPNNFSPIVVVVVVVVVVIAVVVVVDDDAFAIVVVWCGCC